ncbi:hypothetical protein J8273_8128 [Carpediemonas membranifera]|uniref:Uncharacterized protein n=1 Tax=Carpediemonas membranifera TaxID=201153 RepID=A0A8J6APL7_9EUKA|nr:hypothetical protein J8273_8128 [Carpediemonas membranifera]|eukprot:KAG9390091.1 hypothetical protein J8273_8128 [Carpediemonas membranifera]
MFSQSRSQQYGASQYSTNTYTQGAALLPARENRVQVPFQPSGFVQKPPGGLMRQSSAVTQKTAIRTAPAPPAASSDLYFIKVALQENVKQLRDLEKQITAVQPVEPSQGLAPIEASLETLRSAVEGLGAALGQQEAGMHAQYRAMDDALAALQTQQAGLATTLEARVGALETLLREVAEQGRPEPVVTGDMAVQTDPAPRETPRRRVKEEAVTPIKKRHRQRVSAKPRAARSPPAFDIFSL